MNTTNNAVLNSIADHENKSAERLAAEREKAMPVYWSILGDPTRTSPADKAAMAAAMKVLGKTLGHADDDAKVIELMRAKSAAVAATHSAFGRLREAEAALLKYTSETAPALHRQIKQDIGDRHAAINAARSEYEGANSASRDMQSLLDSNAAAVAIIKQFIEI